jgi:catechol 2,3-dioxygenase-like lactoylglutathione lyase family enzyme
MKIQNEGNFIKTEKMIRELELASADLKRTLEFYAGVLGLKVVDTEPGKLAFQLGDTKLVFVDTKGVESEGAEPVYHMAFDIPRNQLQEALNWMAARVEVLLLPDGGRIMNFSNWQAESFYFFDSTGNLLECIVRHEQKEEASDTFGANQLLRVSELGIVTKDVPALVDKLRNEHGLLPFVKQPVLENFAAIGEETGLLILSQEGRNWFPTEVPAKGFYWKLQLSDRKGEAGYPSELKKLASSHL